MSLYEQILELFPLVSYEEDREINGSITFIQETERRTLADGVTYSKNLYRRGNGADVWIYITKIAPGAKAKSIVSACPKYTAKLVIDHAKDYQGKVLYAMNASYFHFFNNGDLTPYGIQITEGEVHAKPGLQCAKWSSNSYPTGGRTIR